MHRFRNCTLQAPPTRTRIAAALAVWLAAQLPLVGVLRTNTVANNEWAATMFRDDLAALGDIDGKTIRLDFRLAEGDAGRLPELASALVRENPAVIVANGPLAIRTAQRATRTIPIVATTGDLVGKLVQRSLSLPVFLPPADVCETKDSIVVLAETRGVSPEGGDINLERH